MHMHVLLLSVYCMLLHHKARIVFKNHSFCSLICILNKCQSMHIQTFSHNYAYSYILSEKDTIYNMIINHPMVLQYTNFNSIF